MATKFVYTTSEIAEITVKYRAGVTLEELAETYNKSVASVRMKLVKLGVYTAKNKTSVGFETLVAKPAAKATTKAEVSKVFDEEFTTLGPALL